MEYGYNEKGERIRRSKRPKMTRRERYDYRKKRRRKIRHIVEGIILLCVAVGYLISRFYL